MAFIGNTPTTQGFIPAIDFFSGNASTTAFTLSRPVASVAQVQATIENVPQNPGDAFTVSGNTITFTSAPPSGTNNIYVYYTSPITQVIQPGQGTVGATQVDGNFALWNKSGSNINYTAGNVGIGTSTGITTVSSGLAINNATAGNYPGLEIQTAGVTRLFLNANNAESYVSSAGTNPLVFYTNSAERMRINSAGQITTPAQPAFLATMGSTQTVVNGSFSIIQLNSASVNRGSHFNTGTYTFTAPVAGVYAFTLGTVVFPATSDSPYFAIRVNGSAVFVLYRYDVYNNISTTVLLSLAANDAVTLYGSGANGQNSDLIGGQTHFTGWLLG
jgi:hypothetical protein